MHLITRARTHYADWLVDVEGRGTFILGAELHEALKITSDDVS